jgi:hypothetical protein
MWWFKTNWNLGELNGFQGAKKLDDDIVKE